MLLIFSMVAKLFLNLRRHSAREPSEDSSSDEISPSSQAPPPSSTVPSTVPSSTPPVHNPSISAAAAAPPPTTSTAPTTPSTPKPKRISKRISQGTPVSHSKSYTSPGSPSSPSSLHYRSSSEPASPSSPRSPRQKPQRTETTSGSEPLSHLGIAETACERREPVERTDTYLCAGGVNALILLRMTRTELMDTVSLLGANALIEEQWKCTIYGPKSKATYKVQIHYKAHGTRSTIPDPHQPVAVDQTHSIPGLMTILRRNDN